MTLNATPAVAGNKIKLSQVGTRVEPVQVCYANATNFYVVAFSVFDFLWLTTTETPAHIKVNVDKRCKCWTGKTLCRKRSLRNKITNCAASSEVSKRINENESLLTHRLHWLDSIFAPAPVVARSGGGGNGSVARDTLKRLKR